jgi:hypothetical protein
MPVYVYCEVLDDGGDGETIEVIQSMKDPPLETHPATGRKLRRVFSPPNVATRYTTQAQHGSLSNERLEKLGFTKYEKDKMTGTYNKVAGKDARAPSQFTPPRNPL